MSKIKYYSCELTSSKKRAQLVVCYSEKKKEVSYEFILVVPHQNFCDYSTKKYKDKDIDIESKALNKAHKIIVDELPNLKAEIRFTKTQQKSFYKYLHKNHCSPFWKMWSVIHSASLKKEMAENSTKSDNLKKSK